MQSQYRAMHYSASRGNNNNYYYKDNIYGTLIVGLAVGSFHECVEQHKSAAGPWTKASSTLATIVSVTIILLGL